LLNTKRRFLPFFIALAGLSSALSAQTVRFNTSLGGIDVALTPSVTPQTVANFMNYVTTGEYNKTIVHRSLNSVNNTTATFYLIQGGGYIVKNHLPFLFQPNDPVPNEFKASNVRGTIAMALTGSDINSGNDEWYFNTSDNSVALDAQTFTVFGKVANNPSLAVMDAINALPTFTFDNFSNFPLLNYTAGRTVADTNYVYVNSISTLAPSFTGVASAATAANNGTTGISPGEIITIYGSNMGPTTVTSLELDSTGANVVSLLEGTQVTFNGRAAPMIFTYDGQVAVVVPYEIFFDSTVNVVVSYLGLPTSSQTFKVVAANPGLFTLSQTGKGDAAIVHATDGSVVSTSNPALPGDVLELYGEGYGVASPSFADGALVTGLPRPVAASALLIDGKTVPTLYLGGAGGEVNGVMQVNFVVPQLAAGSHTIQVQVGNAVSPAGVTLQTK
jgi:uncharacterized protein (TIGR03437 family)